MTALSGTVTPTRRLFCVISTARCHRAGEFSSSWRESASPSLGRATGSRYKARSVERREYFRIPSVKSCSFCVYVQKKKKSSLALASLNRIQCTPCMFFIIVLNAWFIYASETSVVSSSSFPHLTGYAERRLGMSHLFDGAVPPEPLSRRRAIIRPSARPTCRAPVLLPPLPPAVSGSLRSLYHSEQTLLSPVQICVPQETDLKRYNYWWDPQNHRWNQTEPVKADLHHLLPPRTDVNVS